MANTVITWSANLFPTSPVYMSTTYSSDKFNTREELEKLTEMKGANVQVGEDTTMFEDMRNMWDFLKEVKQDGFFIAMYGKSFPQVVGETLKETGLALWNFILSNSDLFFLMPAFILTAGTFFVGRNNYTKWILPLGMAYFVSRILYHTTN